MGSHEGQQLANYRLMRRIGRGGFAEVYLAEHLYLGTQVAIKTLKTHLTDDGMKDFLTEARTIAHLQHPHIVRVIDFGIHDETPFLVMDYAQNGTLRQRHPKGIPLPLPTVVSYVKQITDALQYAHERRLVHRDIKPENILVGRNDELLLSDFGIAVFAHSSLSQSMQKVVGTIAYMAPEQFQGKPRPASDQYALAAVVYEWLCGERLFRGTLVEVAMQQLVTVPPSLREKVPGIPLAVEQVLMTALAKDPKQRFRTIQDFACAFEEASEPISTSVEARAPKEVLPLSGRLLRSGETSTLEAAQASVIGKGNFSKTPSEEKMALKMPQEKRKLWRIGKRQVVPIVLGVLFYTFLSNFMISIALPSVNIPNVLWILPTLVITLFFGVVYGPWVGLGTGGLGYCLGNYLPIPTNWSAIGNSSIGLFSFIKLPWYFVFAFLLIGFVSGFAQLLTKGYYKTLRTLALAKIFAMLAMLCAFFAVFNSFWPHLYSYETLGMDFMHIALPNMTLVLLLLPLMLGIRNFVGRGKN